MQPDHLSYKQNEVNLDVTVQNINTIAFWTTNSVSILSGQNDLVFNWIFPNGTIIGNKNSIKTSQKGSYEISLMNPINFCTSTIFYIAENKELTKFNTGKDV